MDILEQLGALGFASRLRRLGERLQRDVSRTYKTQTLDFEARWFPVLYVLKDRPYMSVTAIAAAIGLTHPAVNQITMSMAKHGIISSIKDTDDERRRLVLLTDKGLKLAEELQPIWRDIESATRDLINVNCNNGVEMLSHIERSLDEMSMYDRVMMKIRKRQLEAVKVVDYRPGYKRYFKELNYDWLHEHFSVEPNDEAVLSDPNEMIIKPGGKVFFAMIGEAVVGTVALLKHNEKTYELTKMAVAKSARRKQVGRKLLIEAIRHATVAGAKSIVLFTSPKLTPAISLYKQSGFLQTEDPSVSFPDYKRKTIAMELNLSSRSVMR